MSLRLNTQLPGAKWLDAVSVDNSHAVFCTGCKEYVDEPFQTMGYWDEELKEVFYTPVCPLCLETDLACASIEEVEVVPKLAIVEELTQQAISKAITEFKESHGCSYKTCEGLKKRQCDECSKQFCNLHIHLISADISKVQNRKWLCDTCYTRFRKAKAFCVICESDFNLSPCQQCGHNFCTKHIRGTGRCSACS